MTAPAHEIVVLPAPTDQVRAAVAEIEAAARETDGAAPFDEHTLLGLDADDGATHLLMLGGDVPTGYARLDRPEAGRPGTAELAVHPRLRRQGYGRVLLERLIEVHQDTRAGDEPLQVWSHGDQPGARTLARHLHLRVVRELRQLRRELAGEPPVPPLPAGVTLRAFRPGPDDAAWLALNARAFAHHPEQGRMTQADLDARIREPWFDPDGFLVAEADGAMVGYHWTKVHAAERLGEVYVLGVDPDRHGGGLGTALTAAGLRHLYRQGLRTVLLYVEGDNAPALAVYSRLEFRPWATDVQYQGAGGPAA
jgi:mycothiol synthase